MKYKALMLLGLLSSPVFAANTFTTGNTISKISAYSNEESIFPTWKGLVQLTVNGTMNWSNGGCDTEHVLIRQKDSHLIDIVRSGAMNGKAVIFGADTSIPKIDGQYCLARSLGVINN